jgi:phage-related minor tail protein
MMVDALGNTKQAVQYATTYFASLEEGREIRWARIAKAIEEARDRQEKFLSAPPSYTYETNLDPAIRWHNIARSIQGARDVAQVAAIDMQHAFGSALESIGADMLSLENLSQRVFSAIVNGALQQLGKLVAGGTDIFGALGQVVTNVVAPKSGFSTGLGAIGSALLGPVGWLAGLFHFQHGGIVTKPTMGLVGEAGPEAIIPLNRMSPALASAGQGGEFHFHLHTGVFMGGEMQARDFAQKMGKYFREENRRR